RDGTAPASRISWSATASRSAVVAPGTAASRTATSALPTIRPAASMASSSPAVRAPTAFRDLPNTCAPSASHRGHRAVVDLVVLTYGDDGLDQLGVVLEQRGGLGAVHRHPVPDDVLGVVLAAPRQHPGDDGLLVDLELEDRVDRRPGVLEHHLERVSLLGAPGVAVQEETLRGVGFGDAGLDHAVGHVRRHEVSGVDVPLGLDAEVGALRDVGPEQVAGRDVGDAELLREQGGLCSLTGAGRAEEDET